MLHTKINSSSAPFIEASPFSAIEKASSSTSQDCRNAPVDVLKLIEALTPSLVIIHVENTEVKSLNKQSSYHYHLLVQHVSVKGKFKSSDECRLKITNLRIYTPAQEVLHSKELSIHVKSSESAIWIDTKLDTLDVTYYHEDIYGWFKKILLAGMRSNRKELIMKAFRTIGEKMIEFHHSEFTQELFKKIVLNTSLSLHNVKLVTHLDDQVSSLNVTRLKCALVQSPEMRRHHCYEDYTLNLILKDREWSLDTIIDGPLCWYMDRKFDYLNLNARKAHVRGSALFIESTTAELSSNDDLINLKLRVNTLRTEYSQKLTNFTVKSIKSFKEFIDLFSQLRSARDELQPTDKKSFSIEKVLSGINIDMRVANVSCFFINRHDVCVFGNLLELKSIDSFNYVLDSLEVSTIDFSKYQSFCDLAEFSTIYVSTKLMKINLFASNDQPNISVDFCETFECSWNAHFLRHLLSLARDFHRFKSSIQDALGISSDKKYLLPRSLPVGLDIKKLRNIRIKHSDVNVDKFILLINELSGENLFFYHYFH